MNNLVLECFLIPLSNLFPSCDNCPVLFDAVEENDASSVVEHIADFLLNGHFILVYF